MSFSCFCSVRQLPDGVFSISLTLSGCRRNEDHFWRRKWQIKLWLVGCFKVNVLARICCPCVRGAALASAWGEAWRLWCSHPEVCPQAKCWPRWSPCHPVPPSPKHFTLFASPWSLWGPLCTASSVLAERPEAGRGVPGGLLLSLVPSACAAVICSNTAVHQAHLSNLIFCISVCLFLYITSSSFLYQIIIIIFEHLCFFCSIWIFAQTYWTL